MNTEPRRHEGTKKAQRGVSGIAAFFVNTSFLRTFVALFLLCSAGCSDNNPAADFGRRLVDLATGRTPTAAAQKVYNQTSADQRREGINELSNRNFGRRAPYTEQYQIMAQTDRDWLVRATAIRALNRSRDSSATPIFVKALGDDDQNDIQHIVRVEACKALVHMPDPTAAAPLVRLLADPSQPRDVRIWAAEALQHYRTLEVARTLASQLQAREFGVAWQSRRSLVSITGQDLGYDEPGWLKYLTGPDRPFG